MFKNIFSLVLLFAFASAQAGSQESLKSAMDDLNYSLSVEWDQNDKSFYSERMNEFTNAVKQLEAQGLTRIELLTFISNEIQDEKLKSDLATTFNMVSLNLMSSEEGIKILKDTLNKTYSKGASWSGKSTGVLVGIGLVGAVLVGGILLMRDFNKTAKDCGMVCENNVCVSPSGAYVCPNCWCTK